MTLTESELTKTESAYLAELHRQSPKEKASKAPSVRRRKRPHAHLRVPHLEEVMSPVTTPTDEDVGHRIKHVAGVRGWRPGRRGSGLWAGAACLRRAHRRAPFAAWRGLCIIGSRLVTSEAPDALPFPFALKLLSPC